MARPRLKLLLVLFVLVVHSALVLCADDYYKILGLRKETRPSDRDVKTAYRRLSKKYHPDKHAGDDKAKDKFVQISEAYEVLSDKEKRDIYDRYGHDGLKQQAQQGQGGGFHNPFDIFQNFFGGHSQQQQVRRGPNMIMELQVELEDIYSGRTYDVSVTRKTICEACDGSGARSAKDIHDCDACQGRGVRIVKHMLAPGMYQQVQMQCDRCGGRGKTIKHLCNTCHGARIVEATSDIQVDIDRGLREGEELVFEGEADENPDWVAGDLVVRIRSRPKQGGFARRGVNLYWKESISVAEALLGFERSITHLDGHIIKLTNPKGKTVQPGYVQILHGEGLPRYHSSEFGELFVEYNVVLPASVTEKTRKKLQEALDYSPEITHKEL